MGLYSVSIPSIDQVVDWAYREFASNDFLIGILVPGILAYLVLIGRGLYGVLFRYLKMTCSSEIVINTDNVKYEEIGRFFFDTTLMRVFQRFFSIGYDWSSSSISATLGYGVSLGYYKGKILILDRAIEESHSGKFKETLTITVLFGRSNTIEMMVKDMQNYISSDDNKYIEIYETDIGGGAPNYVTKRPKRPRESLFLPDETMEAVFGAISKFRSSEQEYIKNGEPYHLGVMLHGVPGTGKSSMAHVIASEFDMNILVYAGGNIRIDDTYFDSKKGVLLLIEDIDDNGMSTKKRKSDTGDMTNDMPMSKVLNMLDGMNSPHGMIVMATTNHIESLDPAILRPGRFDVSVELGKMQYPEWVKMCNHYGYTKVGTKEEYVEMTPAEARQKIKFGGK